MPIYRYTGRDQSGKLIEGTQEASGENEVARVLQSRGILVTKISDTIAGLPNAKPSIMEFGMSLVTRLLQRNVT